MAVDLFEGREVLVSRVKSLLGTLVSSVAIAGQNNLSSSHVVAETTMTGLMNRVYGWELVNANAIRQNYPGIDLIDPQRSIAVQVTANRTTEKVRHTLKEVGKSGIVYSELIVLLLTHSKPTDAMRTCTDPAYSGAVKVWNISDVFRDAMELEPLALQALAEFLETEVGTIRERVKELPHLELPPSGFLQSTGFVGREEELEEISRRFADGDRLVVLTGLGGMGKTELAAKYGRDYPGLVYFVRFDTTFTRTLANMVHGIRPRLTAEELRLEESILIKKVQTLLERSAPEDLLIIDNADSDTGALADLMKEPGYRLLQSLPLRLLVTTRSDYPRAIPVRAMADEPLFKIFRNHDAPLSEPEMRELIRAVNGHTLTVDLIARTLADNWVPVSPPEMLSAISDATLHAEDFPEVGTDYNGDLEQLHIYQRLRGVFQVAKIPPTEQQLLRLATLLPDAGMEVRLFRKALSAELLRVFPGVGKRGWLSADHQMLTIHPVIRLICRTELTPTDEDCGEFLDKLWAQYDQTQYQSARYTQMAELFTIAHDRLGKHHGRWLNRAGILLNELWQFRKLLDLYQSRLPALENVLPALSAELATTYNYYGLALGEMGQYDAAMTYSQKALSIRQAVLPEDDADLARSYNNVGAAYGFLGKHQQALEYKQQALGIFRKVLPPEHPDLATSYIHVGNTYGDLGDHRKALEHKQKALAIREKVLPPEHPHLAASYSSAGRTYGDLGDHHKALEYKLKDLVICEKALPPEHPDLASSYNNVGYTYGALGEHRKALEYLKKALEIREKVLPPEHPHLATSYNAIGSTYGDLGDHHKALEYHKKALEILEKVLPPEHPDLAASYNNVGGTYGDLGDHRKALEYHKKALTICEKALPPEHPYLAASYNNVGGTYGELGEHRKALEYHKKALAIREKAFPPEHPDLATSYGHVGGTYGDLGDHRKALEYHKKALAIYESALPPEHPHLATSYNNVGGTYGDLGDHRKALEYHKKALAIYESALPPEHPHLATSCSNLACTYHELGDFQAAARLMRRAADILSRSSLPETHPNRIKISKWADEFEQKARLQQMVLAQQQALGSIPLPPFQK